MNKVLLDLLSLCRFSVKLGLFSTRRLCSLISFSEGLAGAEAYLWQYPTVDLVDDPFLVLPRKTL